MRSIIQKLILAFLLVGLTGSVLVAVIVRQRTQQAFDQFIFSREQVSLVNNLVLFYQRNGGWEGLEEKFKLDSNGQAVQEDGKEISRDWMRFTLVGVDGRIIYSYQTDRIGNGITKREHDQAVELVLNNKAVGLLIFPQSIRVRVPDSPEDIFIRNVNRAALVSGFVAAVLALILGSFLAYTLTSPLRELTDATKEIARGNLGLQVKVHSQDEMGELATSFNIMSLDLQRATQARQQMTADIAHDLRSPLSVLTGYTEALSEGKLAGTPDIFDILHLETKHLGRLVDDLRTLSLADAGELPLIKQLVQPETILERLAARHAVTAQQKGISIRVTSEPDLPDIKIDVERMAQVLDNLVLNAFRFTAQGGYILLSARRDETGVCLEVQDNGSGIAPEDLPYIFDRFYRGDKARPSGEESGLGLAIARSIVEAHQGTLTVDSAIGMGTTFSIRLRLA